MKSRKFSNALGEINDRYLTEVAEYQEKKQLLNSLKAKNQKVAYLVKIYNKNS